MKNDNDKERCKGKPKKLDIYAIFIEPKELDVPLNFQFIFYKDVSPTFTTTGRSEIIIFKVTTHIFLVLCFFETPSPFKTKSSIADKNSYL